MMGELIIGAAAIVIMIIVAVWKWPRQKPRPPSRGPKKHWTAL